MSTNQPVTGLDLKLERVARGVWAKDVAKEMGISKGRITAIEKPDSYPEAETIRRYRAALDTCAPSSTSKVAA